MKKLNQIALVAAGIAALSVFLPWLEISSSASAGGYSANYSTGGISGITVGGGIWGLLVALIGGYMAYKNIKFTFIAGALNFIIGIGYIFGWFGASTGVNGGFNYNSSYGNASAQASINPQFGLYLFVLASLVFMIYTFKNLKGDMSA
ncbi:MAG: hypothetical protein UZ09_BCD002000447 [Bacteroidetes bacterium OLB9]|nr:MAG: hypothetical protein UZ09_BCD002000447 [Bacteroidetes bacterium OLB9]